MIKLSPEQHKQFIEDVDFANQVIQDICARTINEFWRGLIPNLRKHVNDAYRFSAIVSDFEKRHPESVQMGAEYFVSAQKENVNSPLDVLLEKAWEKFTESQNAGN